MQSMDNIIDNAYKYGRSHIEQYVDDIFNDTDPTQAKKLKCQILSVWDRLIQSWMDRNNGDGLVGPRVSSQSIRMTIDEIFINPSKYIKKCSAQIINIFLCCLFRLLINFVH